MHFVYALQCSIVSDFFPNVDIFFLYRAINRYVKKTHSRTILQPRTTDPWFCEIKFYLIRSIGNIEAVSQLIQTIPEGLKSRPIGHPFYRIEDTPLAGKGG